MRDYVRPLTAGQLDEWLHNWARWCWDVAECYPAHAGCISVEHCYVSPQRNHHEPVRSMPRPIWPLPAERVEGAIHGDAFRQGWRAAVIVEWIEWPSHRLAANNVPKAKWIEKRAAAADMAPSTYHHSLDLAKSRLAAVLGRFRGELPT